MRYMNLPCQTKGFVSLDHNGDYNVYINARLGHYEQQRALQHELRHIEQEDFEELQKVVTIERKNAI